MSHLTLSQELHMERVTEAQIDLNRLLFPGFAHSLAPREVSHTEPSLQ